MLRVLACQLALLGTQGQHRAAAAGDIVAANIRNSTVSLFDGKSGAYKGLMVDSAGGGLQNPTGIAFGPDGHLYVASSRTSQILKYDGTTGAFLGVFLADTALGRVFSIIFGPDHDLYVGSGDRGIVARYHGVTGRQVAVVASGELVLQPIGLRFAPDGRLYFANSGKKNILRVAPGTPGSLEVFSADSLRFPSDLVFDRQGRLFVSDAGAASVVELDSRTGRWAGVLGRLPEGGAPVGLALLADGRVVAGDFMKGRLVAFAGPTVPPQVLSTVGLSGPENIAVKP